MNVLLSYAGGMLNIKLLFLGFMLILSFAQIWWLKQLLPGFFTNTYCIILAVVKYITFAIYFYSYRANFELLTTVLSFMMLVYLLILPIFITVIAGSKNYLNWFEKEQH